MPGARELFLPQRGGFSSCDWLIDKAQMTVGGVRWMLAGFVCAPLFLLPAQVIGRDSSLADGCNLMRQAQNEPLVPPACEAWYCERFGTEFPAILPRGLRAFQPLVDF